MYIAGGLLIKGSQIKISVLDTKGSVIYNMIAKNAVRLITIILEKGMY